MAQQEGEQQTSITIEEYLGGVSPMVNEDVIKMLLVDRDIESGTLVEDMEEKVRDLIKADTLFWCATSPTTTGGWEEQVGNWKTKQSGNTMTSADKGAMKRLARMLYKKWQEPCPYPSSVRVVKKGMGL